MRLFSRACLLALILVQLTAHAQDDATPAEDFFADSPLILTASRMAKPMFESPASVSVIDRQMIESSGVREIADIFRSNSLKNGLLPIVVDEASHALLLANPGSEITIDVSASTISLPDGGLVGYPIDEFARHCLLEGVDQLGFLRQHSTDIKNFEETRSWTP